uniref:MIF4G domain-containing protein n=1 Tax=Bionectria ochroleuca TaxID=29856 RepID=A0A8H7K4X9_BIOOC
MSEKGRPMMDVYFDRIQQMVDSPDLASRMKFMLMDVLDLRRSNWLSKETNKGPKTLEEVRAEAEAAQAAKAQENARNNQRGGGGRPAMGRGDARNFSTGNFQQNSNQVIGDDLRRLKGSANRSSSGNVTLGPTSMFSSRSNSGRRMGPGGALGRPGEDSGASSRTGTPRFGKTHLQMHSVCLRTWITITRLRLRQLPSHQRSRKLSLLATRRMASKTIFSFSVSLNFGR